MQDYLNYNGRYSHDDNYHDVSFWSQALREASANTYYSVTSTILALADALYPNGGFETGDLSGWTPETYDYNYNGDTDSTSNVTVVSPGLNSGYAAYLTAAVSANNNEYDYNDAYAYIYQPNITVVPSLNYTFSFSYKQDPDTVGGTENQYHQLYVQLWGEEEEGYEDGYEYYGDNNYYEIGIDLNPGLTPDSLNNTPGSWNTITAPSFIALSSTYELYAYLEIYNYNDQSTQNTKMGIQLDDFQLLASLPPVPEIGSPFPSCAGTSLPHARFTEVRTTAGDYVFDFQNMLISQNGTAAVQASTTVDSLSACQDELVSVGQEQWSAQYDNTTGSCVVYDVSLCSQTAILHAGSSSYAIQYQYQEEE